MTSAFIIYPIADILDTVMKSPSRPALDSGSYHYYIVICSHYIGENMSAIGLRYDIDYWFDSSYVGPEGIRYVKYCFKDEQTAMLAKLKGINCE